MSNLKKLMLALTATAAFLNGSVDVLDQETTSEPTSAVQYVEQEMLASAEDVPMTLAGHCDSRYCQLIGHLCVCQ